jgi:hypothetical protein
MHSRPCSLSLWIMGCGYFLHATGIWHEFLLTFFFFHYFCCKLLGGPPSNSCFARLFLSLCCGIPVCFLTCFVCLLDLGHHSFILIHSLSSFLGASLYFVRAPFACDLSSSFRGRLIWHILLDLWISEFLLYSLLHYCAALFWDEVYRSIYRSSVYLI